MSFCCTVKMQHVVSFHLTHFRSYCRSFSYKYEYFYSSGGQLQSDSLNCLLSQSQTFGFSSNQVCLNDLKCIQGDWLFCLKLSNTFTQTNYCINIKSNVNKANKWHSYFTVKYEFAETHHHQQTECQCRRSDPSENARLSARLAKYFITLVKISLRPLSRSRHLIPNKILGQ